MIYNRGEYLMHALTELLKGKVWPISLRRKLEDIVATAYLYPIHTQEEREDEEVSIVRHHELIGSDSPDEYRRGSGS